MKKPRQEGADFFESHFALNSPAAREKRLENGTAAKRRVKAQEKS